MLPLADGWRPDADKSTYAAPAFDARVPVDKRLWHLIVGTRGGLNRAKIVHLLRARPYNANALATALGLDYKTVRHHLKVLTENNIVMASRDQTYGTLYFLTPRLQTHYEDFLEIWEKLDEDERRVNGVNSG